MTRTLAWRWLIGEDTPASAFGIPTFDTHYALCAYDTASPSSPLLLEARADGGVVCDGEPCWRPTAKGGFVYRDRSGAADGLTRIELTPGTTGKARVVVKGLGPSLPLPALPLGTSTTVQLQAANGECWQTTFEGADVRRSDATRFRAAHP